MSTIDIHKLKLSLDKAGISIIEYYLLEEKCAMLKVFVYSIQQFLLVYIPTKLRSSIKPKKNMFEIKLLEEVTDEEDYAKFDEFQINAVQQKNTKDTYKNVSQKYNKHITINGDGIEQYEKRVTRQVKRLNIPFMKLDYTLGIQNKKILALHFGEDINLFYIKNYSKDIRCYMYIVNVKELIDNISEIHYEINNINTQFSGIMFDIIESNMREITLLTKTSYDTTVERFKKQKTEYLKKVATFSEFIKTLDTQEKEEIKKYKNLFQTETSNIRKTTLEKEYENMMQSFMKKRQDQIENVIEYTYVFHIFFLLMEEISFDNFIMLKRTTTNFEKLAVLFA